MTSSEVLKYRLPVLVVLLILNETVNLVKLAVAFGWTNHGLFGPIAAATLGSFLIGSIIATSFELEDDLKAQFKAMVLLLFIIQLVLVCTVSFLNSVTLMPSKEIAQMFNTPKEVTQRVYALGEGMAVGCSAVAFWAILSEIWLSEIKTREARMRRLVQMDTTARKEEVS